MSPQSSQNIQATQSRRFSRVVGTGSLILINDTFPKSIAGFSDRARWQHAVCPPVVPNDGVLPNVTGQHKRVLINVVFHPRDLNHQTITDAQIKRYFHPRNIQEIRNRFP